MRSQYIVGRVVCGVAFFLCLVQLAWSDEPAVEETDIFLARSEGYELYRIPGIIATPGGTLLAYCEARRSASGDWGATDVLARRSTDGGQTWEVQRKLVSPPDQVEENAAAVQQKLAQPGPLVNNPVAIADHEGVIHFLYCIEYARCYYMRSDDDGRTFSHPVDITAAFEEFRSDYAWKVLGTGPGHGIQLENGRLLVPIWLSDGTGGHAHRPSCVSVIYSDDHGQSWHRGEIAVAHPDPINPSETAAVQLSNGQVLLNFRHESEPRLRGVTVSDNGATGWSKPRYDPQLPEPVCMGSLLRLSGDKNRILFINPHNAESRARKNLTVKLSYDDAATWPVAKSIEPGVSGYADLAAGPDGMIYAFYERGTRGNDFRPAALCIARFDLQWLTDGRDH